MLNHRKCMTICTLLLLLCLGLTGCGGNQAAESQDTQQASQTAEDGAYTFTDALGQELSLIHI